MRPEKGFLDLGTRIPKSKRSGLSARWQSKIPRKSKRKKQSGLTPYQRLVLLMLQEIESFLDQQKAQVTNPFHAYSYIRIDAKLHALLEILETHGTGLSGTVRNVYVADAPNYLRERFELLVKEYKSVVEL